MNYIIDWIRKDVVHVVLDPTNYWIIGDVHGCHDTFRDMCIRIREECSDAVIIQVGDLIDRGPGLVEVCDVVDEFNVQLIMGNHELNFLLEVMGYKECRSKSRQINIDLFNRYGKSTQKRIITMFQKAQPFMQFVWKGSDKPDRKTTCVIVSHALPGLNLINKSMIGNGWSHSTSNAPMFEVQEQMKSSHYDYSIFGHYSFFYDDFPIEEQLQSKGNRLFNIDSRCVYGGKLTAMRLDLKKMIQIDQPVDYVALYGL